MMIMTVTCTSLTNYLLLLSLANRQFLAPAPTHYFPVLHYFRASMSGRDKPDWSGYNYGAISSLVLMADKSALPRRDKEPDGAPTSLAGRIDPREMGSRVQRQAPKDLEKKKKVFDRQDASEKQPSKRKADA